MLMTILRARGHDNLIRIADAAPPVGGGRHSLRMLPAPKMTVNGVRSTPEASALAMVEGCVDSWARSACRFG
jgi:hypothetical protein